MGLDLTKWICICETSCFETWRGERGEGDWMAAISIQM